MASFLITGCSRGIGHELVSQLLQLPDSEVSVIFATARSENAAITKLAQDSSGRVIYVPLDTTSQDSINSAVALVRKNLNGKGLDVLVNNAGMMAGDLSSTVEQMSDLTDHYAVNVLGTHEVTRAFLPLLRQGKTKKIMNVSTTVGSMGLHERYGTMYPAYKVTKAALNMLTIQWASTLKQEGFTVFAVSPGWLQTDMGSQYADLPVSVGVKHVVEIMLNMTPKDNGRFRSIKVEGWENGKPGAEKGEEGPNFYDGKDSPW